jgi:hypothetical protein
MPPGIADSSQDISLAYPCVVAGDLLLAHDDYYLPSRQLDVEEGGDSTPSSHFIGGTFSSVKNSDSGPNP